MQLNPLAQQKGLTLLESLIAAVIVALGMLGMLGAQMRTLADTQTSIHRAQAIQLIEDLSERTRMNPNSFHQIDKFVSDWTHTPSQSTNCTTQQCNPAELAEYHLKRWDDSVKSRLPLGRSNIFIAPDETSEGNKRQLGVMLSWRENEKSSDSDYKNPISTSSGSGQTISCPAGTSCHLQYIQLSARCAPYFADTDVQFVCSGRP